MNKYVYLFMGGQATDYEHVYSPVKW